MRKLVALVFGARRRTSRAGRQGSEAMTDTDETFSSRRVRSAAKKAQLETTYPTGTTGSLRQSSRQKVMREAYGKARWSCEKEVVS